jgi:hypothetical protein
MLTLVVDLVWLDSFGAMENDETSAVHDASKTKEIAPARHSRLIIMTASWGGLEYSVGRHYQPG